MNDDDVDTWQRNTLISLTPHINVVGDGDGQKFNLLTWLTDNENENIAITRDRVNENEKTPETIFFTLVRFPQPWSHLIKSLSIRRKIVHTWKTYEWSGHHHRFYAGSEGPVSMCICCWVRGRKQQCRVGKKIVERNWKKYYMKKSFLFVDNQKPIYHHLSIWIFFSSTIRRDSVAVAENNVLSRERSTWSFYA